MRTPLRALAVVAALSLVSCASVAHRGAFSERDREAIRAGADRFAAAMQAGDAAALAALYHEDAVLLPPNLPAVRGRDAIRAHLSEFPPVGAMDIRFEEIDGSGDLAYVRGTYVMTLLIEGVGTVEDRGKFLEVRRRASDGSWPMVVDMYSSDLPPAP